MKIKRRGFTLIEILIVVVILAILAALILPKLLSQPEKAYIAEASQMLGTMVRQENNQEAWVAVGTTGFSAIGMTNPDTTIGRIRARQQRAKQYARPEVTRALRFCSTIRLVRRGPKPLQEARF